MNSLYLPTAILGMQNGFRSRKDQPGFSRTDDYQEVWIEFVSILHLVRVLPFLLVIKICQCLDSFSMSQINQAFLMKLFHRKQPTGGLNL